jgi:hypothetical protein
VPLDIFWDVEIDAKDKMLEQLRMDRVTSSWNREFNCKRKETQESLEIE